MHRSFPSRIFYYLKIFPVIAIVLFIWLEGFAVTYYRVKAVTRGMTLIDLTHLKYDAELGWSNIPNTKRKETKIPGATS